MKPHRTDGVSLSFGTIFLLVAIWWAVSEVVNVELPVLGWTAAGVLILIGVVSLLGAIRPHRPQVSQPVPAEAVVETPGDLPPQLHAQIVQELLDDPAARFQRDHPAPDTAPNTASDTAPSPAPSPGPDEPRRG